MTTDRGWKREFDEPIPLPRGRQLVTLEDAGNYITKLPKAEHTAPECAEAAMECLVLVAEKNGPTMLARIGVMRALNRHVWTNGIGSPSALNSVIQVVDLAPIFKRARLLTVAQSCRRLPMCPRLHLLHNRFDRFRHSAIR